MITLCFENADFAVIDKPPGVSFHSEDGSAGLFEQVKTRLGYDDLYPVHRLDKITSGLVIFAKHQQAAAEFGRMFEARAIEKVYLAISKQKPKKKQGWIKGDMAKARRGAYKLLRSMNNPAITRFVSHSIATGIRLYLLKPLSGKTHQLRVAMRSIGAPISGDELYGGEIADRGYLHAYALRFKYAGELFEFVVPPTVGEMFNLDAVTEQLSQQWQTPWLIFEGK